MDPCIWKRKLGFALHKKRSGGVTGTTSQLVRDRSPKHRAYVRLLTRAARLYVANGEEIKQRAGISHTNTHQKPRR